MNALSDRHTRHTDGLDHNTLRVATPHHARQLSNKVLLHVLPIFVTDRISEVGNAIGSVRPSVRPSVSAPTFETSDP